jgi:hypothetical protein
MLVRVMKPIVYGGRLLQVGERIEIPFDISGFACDPFLGWAIPVNSTLAARQELESRKRLAAIRANEAQTLMRATLESDAIVHAGASDRWLRAMREWNEAHVALVHLGALH